MKALTIYSNGETALRQLLRKLQDYGELNCDFKTFSELYGEWHKKEFPGCPVDPMTANQRRDWLFDFISFLANKDI